MPPPAAATSESIEAVCASSTIGFRRKFASRQGAFLAVPAGHPCVRRHPQVIVNALEIFKAATPNQLDFRPHTSVHADGRLGSEPRVAAALAGVAGGGCGGGGGGPRPD